MEYRSIWVHACNFIAPLLLMAGGALAAAPEGDGQYRGDLKVFLGQKLVFVLKNGKVARGVLLSYDSERVAFQNALGTFRIPLKNVRDIYVLTEETPEPDEESAAAPQPASPQPVEAEEPAQQPKKRLEIGVGYIFPIAEASQAYAPLLYPWPAANAVPTSVPAGARATLRYYFADADSLSLVGNFRFWSRRLSVYPGERDYVAAFDAAASASGVEALLCVDPGWRAAGAQILWRGGLWWNYETIRTPAAFRYAVIVKEDMGAEAGIGAAFPLPFGELSLELWQYAQIGIGFFSLDAMAADQWSLGSLTHAELVRPLVGDAVLLAEYEFRAAFYLKRGEFRLNTTFPLPGWDYYHYFGIRVRYAFSW